MLVNVPFMTLVQWRNDRKSLYFTPEFPVILSPIHPVTLVHTGMSENTNIWHFNKKLVGFQSQTSFCWYLLVLYRHDITQNTLYTNFLSVKYGEIPFNPCLNHIESYLFDGWESLFSPFSSLFLVFFVELDRFRKDSAESPRHCLASSVSRCIWMATSWLSAWIEGTCLGSLGFWRWSWDGIGSGWIITNHFLQVITG